MQFCANDDGPRNRAQADVTINDGHLTEAHQRNTAYEPCLIATVLQLALAI